MKVWRWLLTALGCLVAIPWVHGQVTWQPVDEGLEVAELASPQRSSIGTNIITIVRINPAFYSFDLLSASGIDSMKRTAPGWAKEQDLLAAVNASMFNLTDNISSMGYMKDYDHINNPRWAEKYNLVLAFNPVNPGLPAIQLIDRSCQNWDPLKNAYHTYIQGIRVVDCRQRIVWQASERKWSMVLWGQDREGNALWCFTRSPLPVADFAKILMQLNIGLRLLMYLEGGPEASLFLRHPRKTLLLMGSYETGFLEDDSNQLFWPIPNVIGIRKR